MEDVRKRDRLFWEEDFLRSTRAALVEVRHSAGEKSEVAPKSPAAGEADSPPPLQLGVFTQPRWKTDIRSACPIVFCDKAQTLIDEG